MRHLLLLGLTGCIVGSVDDTPDFDSFAKLPPMFDRVVVARVFQKADWTLPAAGPTNETKITYVCNAIAPLHPTYVSGLLRLDDDNPLTADQIAIFNGIRACVHVQSPNAKFDVVLNAEHYTDPHRHPDGLTSLRALQHRADEVKSVLGVDIVFFDFFNAPYNDDHVKNGWYADALTRGTDYIKHTLHLQVTGNVWGFDAPPNTDFVTLDNFDRPNLDGFAFDKQQIAAFRKQHLPVMLHIENNPQNGGSNGLAWIRGTPDYRRDELQKYASAQKREGFSYMYPVFFPLKCCTADDCGPDTCNDHPTGRIAYDATADTNLLMKMADDLDRY